jgi:hypothetical protein
MLMVRLEDVAHAVADAVLAVPGVAGLSPGRGVEVSTQFPGGKVVGVRLSGDEVCVRITADRVPLPAVAAQVRASARRVLAAAGDDRPVTVFIDDVTPAALDRRGG